MIKKIALILATIFIISSCKEISPPEDKSTLIKYADNSILSTLNDTSNSEKVLVSGKICGQFDMPKKLKELNQTDIFSSNVSLSVGTDISAYGFSGTMGKKDIMVASYFVSFRDFTCTDGTKKRAMVGLKLYVHASELDIKLKTPSLPQISAAVQLGLAKAEYRISILGLSLGDLYSQLPSASFDVNTYSKVISSYDNLVHSLNKETDVDPVIANIENGAIKF